MNPLKMLATLVIALACLAVGVQPAAAAAAEKRPPAQLEIESARVGTKVAPVVVQVRAGVFAKVAIWVNGRRVRHPFEYAGRGSQAIDLQPGDGLRPGANRLRIRAKSGGRVAIAKRTVRLGRRALLADAGADVGTAVKVHTRVGARVLPGGPAGLSHRWRIVERPAGSRASLRDRDERRPVLRAHTPGTYVLQMEARTSSGQRGFDQVTVPVAPPDPPIGAPVDTITPSGAISIGGREFGANANGLAYVVLERTTRQPVRNADGSEVAGSVATDAAGIGKLADLARRYSDQSYMQYLMIVSGRSGIPAASQDSFGRMLRDLGVARLDAFEFAALERGGQFSVIGIPGAPYGAGTVRVASLFFPATTGGLIGYLQKNQAVNAEGTPVYDFAAPEHPAFDTRAAGSSDRANKMVVNGIEYAGVLAEGATAGFHVVVLESLTLKPLDNLVLATNGGSDRSRQEAAANGLKNALERRGGPTVLVQTIGKPKGAGPEWDGIVEQLARLGANRLLVYALDGSTEYALVGRLGSEQPPAESSNAYDHGPYAAPQYPPAHLVGVLARTRDSHFEPTVSSTPTAASPEGAVNLRLVKVAYQQPQPWPPLAPAEAKAGEEAKVQKFICERLGFCKPADTCQSLRDCYWDSYNDVDWDAKEGLLAGLEFPGEKPASGSCTAVIPPDASGGKGFSCATFKSAKDILLGEIAAVGDVRHYLVRLQEPFLQSEARSYVDLKKISKTVWDAVQQPAPDNSTSWAFGLVSKIALLGNFAGPPISGASAGISAIFGLSAYMSNKQGKPILGGEIKAKADELGDQIFERVNTAARTTTALGKLIVSDRGKLMEIDQHLHDASWKLPDPENAQIPLQTASKQWFYEALVPTAYPYLVRGGGLNARTIDCQMGSGRQAWPRQPDEDQMDAIVGYDGGGSPIYNVFFFTRGIGGGSNPPPSLGQAMFRPREAAQSGLGMEKLHFFTPRVFGGKIAHAVNGVPLCRLGWLPEKY